MKETVWKGRSVQGALVGRREGKRSFGREEAYRGLWCGDVREETDWGRISVQMALLERSE